MEPNVFSGKKAVVTGASKGIGYAIARQFALKGAEVFLLASNAERLEEAAKSLFKETNNKPRYFSEDLRTFDGCQNAYTAAIQSLSTVDFLVNNAGATKSGAFVDQLDEDMVDGFALKFFGAVRLCRLFWPSIKQTRGVVINIVGGFARTPDPDFIIGGAVNAALANFSKALAGQGLRDDINVNWIHPGITVTDRLDEIFKMRAKLEDKSRDQLLKEKVTEENLRRLGKPDDVASIVTFLCSSEARHIHGVGIPVDGGGAKGYY